MESNFDFLNDITLINNDKLNRYKRDALFLAIEVERHLYLRETLNGALRLRMLSEVTRKLLKESIDISEDTNIIEWSKILKKSWKRRLEETNVSEYTTPSFNFIFGKYPNKYSHTKDELLENFKMKDINNILSKMQGWMHYDIDLNHLNNNNFDNINDNSSLFQHRRQTRYRMPEIELVSEFLNLLFDIFIYISKINKVNKEFPPFDKSIYNDTKMVMNKLLENKYIDSYINKKWTCPNCNEGKFYITDDKNEKMPFGAFITCDNKKCQAKIDKTLKVKSNLEYSDPKNSKCELCNGKIQLRYNLRTKEKYKACNKCEWNDKNNNEDLGFFYDGIEEFDYE